MKTNYINLFYREFEGLGNYEPPEEKAKRLGVRLIPPLKKEENIPININPTVAICGECGVEWKKIMHYSCNRNNCPMQTKYTL